MHAAELLQNYLDLVAAAIMNGDWETYENRVMLPLLLVTHAENIVVSTPDDLRAGFDTFRQALEIQKVTDYVRLVETAKIVDDDLLTGRYITHLIAGAHRILQPYTAQITLRRNGGVWRAASITNGLANSRIPFVGLSVADTPPIAEISPKEGPTK